MPGRWVLWQCKFSPECRGESATKHNGELDSMCETHRQKVLMSKTLRPVLTVTSPLSRPGHVVTTKTKKTAAPSPNGVVACSTRDLPRNLCKHPTHCIEERAVKKNGGLHWLCERHRQLQNAEQRQRYQRKKQILSSRMAAANQPRDVDSSGAASGEATPNASQSQTLGSHSPLGGSETTTAPDATLLPAIQPGVLVENQQCGHRSVCDRARVLKKNGERHWLCEHHRQQQNTLQRRRRRQKMAIRRMVKNRNKSTGDPVSNSPAMTLQRCTQENSTVHPSQELVRSLHEPHARNGQAEDSSAARFESAAIPEALVSVLTARRDEVVRRIQADELFLQLLDEMWPDHLRRLE